MSVANKLRESVFDDLTGVVCLAGAPAEFEGVVYAEEAALVAGAIEERRQQFFAARAAAREALAIFGRSPAPLVKGANGAPVWPPGIAGSLAHCRGQVVAAVAIPERWKCLGVDVEPDAPLPDDAAKVVITAADRALFPRSSSISGVARVEDWQRLVFCAKECVHKCLNPLRGAWLEFDEVAILMETGPANPECGRFLPQPLSDAARSAFAGLEFEGRWRRRDGFVLVILAAV